MNLFAGFLDLELRLARRSLRMRVLGVAYVVSSVILLIPALLMKKNLGSASGVGNWIGLVAIAQPTVTAILAFVAAADGLSRESDEGSASVLHVCSMPASLYLLRRWFGVLALVLPLSLLAAAIAAAAALATGCGAAAVSLALAYWLVQTLPAALVFSAFGLAFGTIGGSFLMAAVLYLLARVGLPTLIDLFAPRTMGFVGFNDWMGIKSGIDEITNRFGHMRWGWIPATGGAFDLRLALRELVPPLSFAAATSLLGLAIGARYLRRTRPNIRPWKPRPDHPLRSFIGLANRIRLSAVPDAGADRLDRAFVLAALGLFALVTTALIFRHLHWLRLGETRNRVELSGQPAATPLALAVQSWQVEGELSGRRMATTTSIELRNDGSAPAGHVALVLDPLLDLQRVEVAGSELELRSEWGRVAIDLEPPLALGETRNLTVAVSGTPGDVDFSLPMFGRSFVDSWAVLQRAKTDDQRTDLSRSRVEPAISDRRIFLSAAQLGPIVRYTPFDLTPPPKNDREPGRHVPAESVPLDADITLSLRVPNDRVFADTCGHLADNGRLEGRCRAAPADFQVLGGDFELTPAEGVKAFFALPASRRHITRHGELFAEAAAEADRAWPGRNPFPNAVVFDWPPPFALDPWQDVQVLWTYSEGDAGQALWVNQQAILIPEGWLAGDSPISAGYIAQKVLAESLISERSVPPLERRALRQLYSALLLAIMATKVDATVDCHGTSATSFLNPNPYDGRRNRAVANGLRARIGAPALRRGIEAFLAAGPAEGSLAELAEHLSAASGVDLAPFFADYVTGTACPRLTLEDVRFARSGAVFSVSGRVRNTQDGRADVPVVLRTALDSQSLLVSVGAGSSTAFQFDSPHRPSALQLDPDERTFRCVGAGIIARVEPKEW